MQDQNPVETTEDVIVDDQQLPSVDNTNKPMTADQILTIIRTLVNSGQITTGQAKDMRRKFGITQGYFTAKRFDKSKRKAASKLARANRVRNRKNGSTKGQKRTNGTFG